MSDLYRELILDHWRSPRHAEPLQHATHRATVRNQACGDEATVELVLDPATNRLTAVSVQVNGCALSTAAGSVLGEELAERPVEQLRRLKVDDVREFLGESTLGPSRQNCLRIALDAAIAALNNPTA